MKITEKQFLNTVRETALRAGWLFYHVHDSRRSDPGFPDCVLAKNGHLWFIELKSEKGKLTPEQSEWITRVNQCATPNVRGFLLRPSLYDDFWKTMRRI